MTPLPWTALLDCTGKNHDIPRSTLANAVTVLQHDPLFGPDAIWYDEFLDRVRIQQSPAREWRDDDDTRLTVYMQQSVGMVTITEGAVSSAVRHVARQRTRHCVRDQLQSVLWDGELRIAHAFEDVWGAKSHEEQPLDYLRAISANFFIGLVARVMRPGCHLDNMVVFEGPQGIGKSKALRVLGGEWYMLAAESVTGKDFFQTLPGSWLVEIGELEAFSRAERERVKVAISTPADKYRASYGRHPATHPRQCVFAGTTNRDDWGNDDTGLRRFWPVQCGAIDIPAVSATKDQWFAEALAAFHDGVTWWETPPSTLRVQANRQPEDAWTPTVRDWTAGKPNVTSAEILIDALKFRELDITRAHQHRISSILRLDHWVRKPVRRNGKLVKGYVAPDVTVTVDDETTVTF